MTSHRPLAILVLAAFLVAAGCGQSPPHPAERGYYGDPPEPPFDPRTTAAAEEVERFLEPAPAGHAWRYQRDWDDAIVDKCLVPERGDDAVIDWSLFYQLQAQQPPQGYKWTAEGKPLAGSPANVLVRVCIRRIACQYGKFEGLQECITPQ